MLIDKHMHARRHEQQLPQCGQYQAESCEQDPLWSYDTGLQSHLVLYFPVSGQGLLRFYLLQYESGHEPDLRCLETNRIYRCYCQWQLIFAIFMQK